MAAEVGREKEGVCSMAHTAALGGARSQAVGIIGPQEYTPQE